MSCWCTDYGSPDSSYMVQLHSAATGGSSWTKEQIDSFDSGGFSVFQLGPSLWAVNLNTVIYTTKFHNTTERTADPYSQFMWLNQTLTDIGATGAYAYVLGHVPPTLDSFAQRAQWEDRYVSTYMELIAEHSTVIKAQLYGHVHKDEFRYEFNQTNFFSSATNSWKG